MTASDRTNRQPGMAEATPICTERWFTSTFRPSKCLLLGLLVGIGLAIVSQLIGNLPSGHRFNDPILLGLSIGTLLRSFIYFNWRNFLITLAMPVTAGFASWLIVRQIARALGRQVLSKNTEQAARFATLAAIVPVWFIEIDAFQVLIWYGISTWLAVILAGRVARMFTRIG